MKLLNKNLSYWLRVIHRDLGYLMVGLCIVYGVSGMLLNHMDGKDPAFVSTSSEVSLEKGLDVVNIKKSWNKVVDIPILKRVFPIDGEHYRLMLEGGVGVYNSSTGIAEYEVHKKRPIVYWLNRLHYNRVQGWSFMGDFFAVSLIFFAISGLFMVKGKNGFMRRGKWLFLVGLLIPVLYIIISGL